MYRVASKLFPCLSMTTKSDFMDFHFVYTTKVTVVLVWNQSNLVKSTKKIIFLQLKYNEVTKEILEYMQGI